MLGVQAPTPAIAVTKNGVCEQKHSVESRIAKTEIHGFQAKKERLWKR
ncbi:hypothetical protein [Sporosarcina koreensis]|nr:hypothetical protein [Sporosarcina koreensis]